MTILQRVREWIEARGGSAHSQDIAKEDRKEGFDRRGWLRLWGLELDWQLVVPNARFGLTVGVGTRDGGVHGSVCCPPVSLFWGVESRALNRAIYRLTRGAGMSTGVRIFDWAIWWEVWHPEHSWTSGTPRWRHGSWHFLDTILGKQVYAKEILSVHEVSIPMPERSYRARVELEHCTWIRPRWPWAPFSKRGHYAKVDMLKGEQIGVPGKGESSYDCGDDALFGLSCEARTIEDAVAETVRSAMRSRRRYGGGTGTDPWKAAAE